MAKAIRPKYQVFISSTYENLRPEREAITWALLSARHIPVGMENFTPSDDRGWRTIQSIIDKTDYYVLILTDYYGTPDEDGLSWTEKEYDYAVLNDVPVLAFIKQEDNNIEEQPINQSKRKDFHDKVRSRHLTNTWRSSDELCGLVVRALENHIKDDEDTDNPRPGWYRGSNDSVVHNSKADKTAAVEYHGLTFDELKAQMESDIVVVGWNTFGPEKFDVWEFFLMNVVSLAKKDIWKDSVTGQSCPSLVAFDIARVAENDHYELTDLGFKLMGEVRKRGML